MCCDNGMPTICCCNNNHQGIHVLTPVDESQPVKPLACGGATSLTYCATATPLRPSPKPFTKPRGSHTRSPKLAALQMIFSRFAQSSTPLGPFTVWHYNRIPIYCPIFPTTQFFPFQGTSQNQNPQSWSKASEKTAKHLQEPCHDQCLVQRFEED